MLMSSKIFQSIWQFIKQFRNWGYYNYKKTESEIKTWSYPYYKNFPVKSFSWRLLIHKSIKLNIILFLWWICDELWISLTCFNLKMSLLIVNYLLHKQYNIHTNTWYLILISTELCKPGMQILIHFPNIF